MNNLADLSFNKVEIDFEKMLDAANIGAAFIKTRVENDLSELQNCCFYKGAKGAHVIARRLEGSASALRKAFELVHALEESKEREILTIVNRKTVLKPDEETIDIVRHLS